MTKQFATPSPTTQTVNVVVENPTTGASQTYAIELRRLAAGEAAILTSQEFTLPDEGDELSRASLAVSADGNTIAASSVNDDGPVNAVKNSGAVYVFRRSSIGMWSQEAYLRASNADVDDGFGREVSLSADGNVLAVGASDEDSNGIGIDPSTQADNSLHNAGAIYIFRRTGTTWAQANYIKAPRVQVDNYFGSRLALSATAKILATMSLNPVTTVHVYQWSGTTWVADKPLQPAAGNYFDGIAISGDGQRIAVATTEDLDRPVRVFTRGTDGVWSLEQAIQDSQTVLGDAFGGAISLSHDGSRLAVGAPYEASSGTGVNSGTEANNGAYASGAAYIFERTGTTWTKQAYLKASNTKQGQEFAGRLAISGDGTTLLVGAEKEASNGMGINSNTQSNTSATNAGAVYVFHDSGSGWAQVEYVKASDNAAGRMFGCNTAISFNGTRAAVGAYAANETKPSPRA